MQELYRPLFHSFISNTPHAVTVIKNFSGTVSIKYESEEGDMTCFVEGEGSTNFISKQTGF